MASRCEQTAGDGYSDCSRSANAVLADLLQTLYLPPDWQNRQFSQLQRSRPAVDAACRSSGTSN